MVGKNETENAVNLLKARNRHNQRRRSSQFSSTRPKISVTNEIVEKLIPPPAPSPSAIRILERLDRSRTESPNSTRTGSPPDIEGKQITSPSSLTVSPEKGQQQQQHIRSIKKVEMTEPRRVLLEGENRDLGRKGEK